MDGPQTAQAQRCRPGLKYAINPDKKKSATASPNAAPVTTTKIVLDR
ncbi:hypothetical protein [Streptomyces europaeiscabiei]|nr:hypothetical protein [Streptomyces europaeiscabiei]MDX3617396.1 hypothetical protein [Streptomyces europaeiscabiei]MDX3636330.1 hypothetical protein [Streptomyces europaeiscabiei]